MQRIVREWYESLYGNKVDNLEEMDEFLETRNPPILNKKELGYLNRLITSYNSESVMTTFST